MSLLPISENVRDIETSANIYLLSTGNSATEVPKDDLKLGKTKSKDSKAAPEDILAIVDEADEKSASPKEDKKSAKSSSGWGSLWGSSDKTKTSKDTKKAQEEAQRKADEDAFAAALGEDPGDILDFVDEAPAKKSSKDKDKDSKKKSTGTDKLSKTESKSSKRSDPIVEAPEPDPLDDLLNGGKSPIEDTSSKTDGTLNAHVLQY